MNEGNEYRIEVDSLAVGLTRPSVYMGVDMRFFFANVVLGVLICIYTKSLYGVIFSLITYLIMRRLSQKDIKFFSLYWTFLQNSMPVLNSKFWGGTNSYEPW